MLTPCESHSQLNWGQVEETVLPSEKHQAVCLIPGLKFLNSLLYWGVPSQEFNPALWTSEKQIRFLGYCCLRGSYIFFLCLFVQALNNAYPLINRAVKTVCALLFFQFFLEKVYWSSAVNQTAQHPCFSCLTYAEHIFQLDAHSDSWRKGKTNDVIMSGWFCWGFLSGVVRSHLKNKNSIQKNPWICKIFGRKCFSNNWKFEIWGMASLVLWYQLCNKDIHCNHCAWSKTSYFWL